MSVYDVTSPHTGLGEVKLCDKIYLVSEEVPPTTFPEYLFHNIKQSKLFVVQTLLEIAELQNY